MHSSKSNTQKKSLRGRWVCQLKTQCSVFKHWTLVFRWQKYMFGLSVQNAVVWKLLLKNQCLNNMFWNVAGGDFKQWTHVFYGNYVINLNTFTQLFWLLMDPLISFFYKNKHTYQTHFLCFLNAETRYLNYDTIFF